MTLEQMNKIKKWNLLRDNNKFDYSLETNMFNEENREFYEIYNAYLISEVLTLEAMTKMCDAHADSNFVLGGTIHKASTSVMTHKDYDHYASILAVANHEINLMTQFIAEIVPFGGLDLDHCLELVIEANEQKSTTRNEYGKITKPEGFIAPDQKIKEYLMELDTAGVLCHND